MAGAAQAIESPAATSPSSIAVPQRRNGITKPGVDRATIYRRVPHHAPELDRRVQVVR